MDTSRRGSQRTAAADFTTPRSLPDFQRLFPDEGSCVAYRYVTRFPAGFICPYCQTRGEPYRFQNQPDMLRCRLCKRNARLTAGTIMRKSKMPISTWFWGA
jgi:hypothetical protein